MQSLFKSIFSGGKTAVLTPPAELHGELPADLSLAPPKSSSASAAAPAPAPSIEPKPDDPAVLQDFLLNEQSAQTVTAAPEPPLIYTQTSMAAPEPPFSYAHIPEPLPDLTANADVIPDVIPETSPEAHAGASLHENSIVSSDADANAHANPDLGPIALRLTEPEEEVVAHPEV